MTLTDRLAEALRFFTDRESPITAKFDLWGPGDTAKALHRTFNKVNKLLAEYDALGRDDKAIAQAGKAKVEKTWRDREPPHCPSCDCGNNKSHRGH